MPWIRIQGLKKDDADLYKSNNMGLTDILGEVFPAKSDFERCIAHLYHAIMRNGARDRCDHFVSKSFVGYTVPDILNTGLSADTRFFDMMGDDDRRMAFFQAFVRLRRVSDPEFGRCCYVDSKPLPDDIEDNPFNAFSSHGDSGIRCRLVLVADIAFDVGCIRSRLMPGKHQG